MTSSIISDEKIEQYKIILKRPYWELHEAAHFLSGNLKFALRYSLDEEASRLLNTESFGLIPLSWKASEEGEKPFQDEYNQILEKIYTAIQNDEVRVRSFKFDKGIRRDSCFTKKNPHLTQHTYFLHSDDAIAIAITEGIQLPFELQIASNLYQTKKPTKAKKGGWKNETRREALAQVYWYENPQGSIQGSVRNAFQLKMESRKRQNAFFKMATNRQMTETQRKNLYNTERQGKFEFVNGNGENTPKNRGRIKNIKCPIDLVPTIPGVMIKNVEYAAFDYMNLKIVLETIADYLCFTNPYLTSEELLSHPLIQMYSQEGGLPLNKIVKFSLKKTLEFLDVDDSPPEF